MIPPLTAPTTTWWTIPTEAFTRPLVISPTSCLCLLSSGLYNLGITYDKTNNSLWISGWGNTIVTDYSLSGTVISSFDTGHNENGALAMDPATHTLWLVDDENTFSLEQYSTAGVLLSTGPYVGYSLGGEFDMGAAPTPEPGTLIMFGSGILGLAGRAAPQDQPVARVEFSILISRGNRPRLSSACARPWHDPQPVAQLPVTDSVLRGVTLVWFRWRTAASAPRVGIAFRQPPGERDHGTIGP